MSTTRTWMCMWMTRAKAAVLVALLAAAGGASSCGGVTDARVAARNRASKAVCDRANACGGIGPGQTYADYQSCISIINGTIDSSIWPVDQCQQINQSMLDVCISAIMGTQCGNNLNAWITLGTCSAPNVCIRADAGSGG